MALPYFENEDYQKIDYAVSPIPKGKYENCSFVNCNFLNADLSSVHFTECEFVGCNLSMAKLSQTSFCTVQFKDCKMLGLHFDHCNEFLFAVAFENCQLNLSSFYGLKLKKTLFKNTTLQEVDFSDADLTQASFDQCDLLNAIFDNTLLEKADFRTAYNYIIHPEKNRLKKAKFSVSGLPGLLQHFDIEIVD